MSKHKTSSTNRRRILVENLVHRITSLDPRSQNFGNAVQFCLSNFDDHYYLSPQPTAIKGTFNRMLDKLEFHSRHEKHKRLVKAFQSLTIRPFSSNQWEEEEIMFSKFSLLLHLTENVLDDYSLPQICEGEHLAYASEDADLQVFDVGALAESIRRVDAENAELSPDSSDAELSDWGSEVSDAAEVTLNQPAMTSDSVCSNRLSGGEKPFDEIWCKLEEYNSKICHSQNSDASDYLRQGFSLHDLKSFQDCHFSSDDPCSLALSCLNVSNPDCLGIVSDIRIIDELTVFRETVLMLGGLPSDLYSQRCPDKASCSEADTMRLVYVPNQDFVVSHISFEALQSLLRQFASVGSMHLQLSTKCQDALQAGKNICATRKALYNSIQGFLTNFQEFLSELTVKVAHNTHLIVPNSGSESLFSGFTVPPNLASPTLICLEQLLSPHAELLACLMDTELRCHDSSTESRCNSHQAFRAIQVLYECLENSIIAGNEQRFSVFKQLFVMTTAPYIVILDNWLFHGSLASDLFGEFFIQSIEDSHQSADSEDVTQQGERADKQTSESAKFWRRFKLRDGGELIHAGSLRAAQADLLSFDLEASAEDGVYVGMTVRLLREDDKTLWAGVIVAYNGAKRRATVDVSSDDCTSMGKFGQNCMFRIYSLVPKFLRPLSFRILSAGKSLNVLLLEAKAVAEVNDLISQYPLLERKLMNWMTSDVGEDSTFSRFLIQHVDGVHSDCKDAVNSLLEGNKLKPQTTSDCISRAFEHSQTKGFWNVNDGGSRSSSLALTTTLPCSLMSILLDHIPTSNQGSLTYPKSNRKSHGLCASDSFALSLGQESVLASELIDEHLLNFVRRRVGDLNSALVSHLMHDHRLLAHLVALRRIFFMQAGDVLHAFALELFEKLDIGEDAAVSDSHTLDALLRSCLPSLPGMEHSKLTAFIADDSSDGIGHTIGLVVPASQSILALDRIRLSYQPGWPISLVIDQDTLDSYNQILIFLLQIKRAKCALDHMRDRAAVPQMRLKIGQGHGSSARTPTVAAEGSQLGSVSSTSKFGSSIPSNIPDRQWSVRERYGWWNPRLLLLRAELRHIVNNVENYIMTQIHGADSKELERQISVASALDQITAAHSWFLRRMRDKCLLHQRAAVVADTIRRVLDLSLSFRSAFITYQRAYASLMRVGPNSADLNSLDETERELDQIRHNFRRCTRLLVVVLEKLAQRGFHPHLEDLLTRLSFNQYYCSELL